MFSIDQNCHPFWDALPKLHALAAHGHSVTHFVEDIDVAFTAMGASVEDAFLHVARERFYRSGGEDWGAALFYSEFLARQATEIRAWEPFTGMKTNTLARQLGRSVDDLYEEFSPGDTWQLIGPSYVGDREHHRVVGDLSVRETADFVREILLKAKEDMLRRFPQGDSQERLTDWFRSEEERVERLLKRYADARVVDLYRGWLGEHLSSERLTLALSSDLFAVGADPARTALLEVFLKDYERAARLYAEALAEAGSDLHALEVSEGELPFFAVQEYEGHLVRTAVHLRDDAVVIGRRAFKLGEGRGLPVAALAGAGIKALAAKAILLVAQARIGPAGQPLALPYRGSVYMPAAHRLAAKLAANGLLPGQLQPIIRVRFRLLDHLKGLDTVIRLPGYLEPCFGKNEVPARELGEKHAALAQEAAQRLERIRDAEARKAWQKEAFPDLTGQIEGLERRRREMAASDVTPEQMSEIWKRIKAIQLDLLDRTVRQIARDLHVRELDYWDSRGAVLPWSIALGGREFYDRVIADAEICEERPAEP